MLSKIRVLQRASYTIVALVLVTVIGGQALSPKSVLAEQLALRSIALSDSGPSGSTITTGIGSGTNVTYGVSFTTFAPADSIIIDFCVNNPIIADTCTEPTGMSVTGVTLSGTGAIASPGWSATGITNGTGTSVQLAKTTGATAAAGAHTFNLEGIINPSTTGTFYARIYTYADATFGSSTTAWTAAETPGAYVDYGGVALSTNQIITITARVQEQLTFCVSGAPHSTWAVPNMDCSTPEAATPPALILGHGTPTAVLDTTAIDKDYAYSQVSTNATEGIAISLRNSNAQLPTPCGGLSANGQNCAIPAVNSGGFTIGTMTIGDAAFGVAVNDGVLGVNGTGIVTADANYRVDTANTDADGHSTIQDYGMDEDDDIATTGNDEGSVIGTFGDRVAFSDDPVYRVNNTYTFAATASLTTPAGIYTANIDLVATGKF